MKATSTKLAGVYLLEPTVHGDSRGHFFESFNNHRFEQLTGFLPHFVQDNQSMSAKSVLRGLHFQTSPKAQGKLVRVVQGAVYDVAMDIRPDSPTFGQWEGVELSAHNHHQLWIPPGLAHGFLTLEDHTVFQYKTTDYWSPEHERCIAWDDPELNIQWPVQEPPLISDKDAQGQSMASFREELLRTINSHVR